MKKKLLALLMGISLVMGLAACGGSNNSDTSQSRSAEQIASQSCTSCHGENLKGAVGPDLRKIGSKYSKDEILDIIENGTKSGRMQGGIITGEDADKVADWLAAKK